MKQIFLLCLYASLCATAAAQSAPRSSARPVLAAAHNSAKVIESYGKLPLAFEANQGQADSQVKFLSRGAGYSLFLTPTEAVLALSEGSQPGVGRALLPAGVSQSGAFAPKDRESQGAEAPISHDKKTSVLRMKLVGADAKAEVIGQDELPGKSNYFIGNDPKKWHTNVRQFAKVHYENVYPGVDLVYYGHQRELEYDFVLQPGANPQVIRLGIEGARKLRLEHGELVLASAAGDVHLRAPHVYQEANGVRQDVRGRYIITSKHEVGFRVTTYDRRRALVIDPVLAYSTYLGGTGLDYTSGIAVDPAGNAYVTGLTTSADFPMANAIQHTYSGNNDAFVSKINADGSALVYSTYLGGSNQDGGSRIAVDAAGNAYVSGQTLSADFPVVNAIQSALHGFSDAFVTKISADGTGLVYSTYLGGSGDEGSTDLAVNSAGDVYATGSTGSTDFPTVNPIQSTNHGGSDSFVTKINADDSAIVYSTYLGGSMYDHVNGIAVDAAGKVYLSGETQSTDFPTKNAIQATYAGNSDAFVTKINAGGSALVYSTYLGGSLQDVGARIAVDSAGNAYVTGFTSSTDLPTANAIQPANAGVLNAFVTKINANGSAFVYSTYLGGSVYDGGVDIAADSLGEAFVVGWTWSADFPTINAIQPTLAGNSDAFVTKINAEGSGFVYSTYLGGRGVDSPNRIEVDSAGSAYIGGLTKSSGFPKTALAFQMKLKGKWDGFVAKIAAQTFVGVSSRKTSFSTQVMGTTSAAKKITVTNQGSGTLTINRIYIGGANPGDFAETNTCGSSLAAGASCTVSVTFTPTDKNLRQAVLGISDSDPASPQAIPLGGIGTVVSLSKKKLSFGNQLVGTTSGPQKVTLTNVGGTPLNFTGITITGTNAGDFSQTNTCGTSIAGGDTCTISVTFTPSAQGRRNATLSISDDGGGSPQKVMLTGTGT
jgi:hypothetical protein